MRAAAAEKFNATPLIIEAPTPAPAAGEVLVKVAASSINNSDLMYISGAFDGMMEHRFPLISGGDVAGTVEAVGEGVSGFSIGDRIFGTASKAHAGEGSWAQFVAAPAANLAKVPDGLDLSVAGAIGIAATAALESVNALGDVGGKTILVSGATGGVGAFAVQFLTQAGARVIATAKSGKEIEFVKGLAPTAQTVDYTRDLAAQVRVIAPDGVDGVLHFAGDAASLATLVRSRGIIASTIGEAPVPDGVAFAMIWASPSGHKFQGLGAQVASGTIKVPTTATYKLEEIETAISAFKSGTVGKIALVVS
jgi:NADPH:quinone reductase-like Zn-dependent oxidoreductase